jgi:hypothetical protein
MLRLIKLHYKKIIFLAIVIFFWTFLISSFNRYIKRKTKLHEKTTFTDQETKILWSELGLDYIDLKISKAYFNYDHDLYVISEEFDSVDAEIKYLKKFDGNENIHEGTALERNHKGDEVSELFDIKCTDKGYFSDCFTYEENGKYYLEFYNSYAKGSDLYEIFGLNGSGDE